ncbi:MAG TPA: hypothetical protein VFI25_00050 [Planctomycetota bacterium]|jgi:hypothetical protein|nr:hypothetical protein [Planctomycetota bacterium]
MATITSAQLTITHDHHKRTARCVVKCNVNFTPLELCYMKTCTQAKLFKLKCQLWGADSGLYGGDDHLFTYSPVKYFPDASPTATETALFDVLLGEGVLDEDWGQDEIYGKLILQNLFSMVQVTKKTNQVNHSF